MMTMSRTIRLHEKDNVVVARVAIAKGTSLNGEGLVANEDIPAGHKVATRPIANGGPITKFNQTIAFATADIAAGDHVHTPNAAYGRFERDSTACVDAHPTDYVPEAERATFQGYRRASGKAGTRNYVGILTSVNCSATVARLIAEAFHGPGALADYPNVDGVVALVHTTGCGMRAGGEGHELLNRTIAGYAVHPNLAGVLLIGLGCEVAQVGDIESLADRPGAPPTRTMTIQEEGGTRRTVEKGIAIVREMLVEANKARRETIPASELTLALQCGGSDGYSGIGANPALGVAADLLVRHGGTAILSETPEIYGAEHLLVRRAVNDGVAAKLIERIKWWEDYTARNGGEIDNNPAPGNKAGGLTTILEKALGSAAKGGTTNLVDVYRYAEPITAKGFVFMDSPGFDPTSATGQVASGANIICFTTGRGSVFGFKPVPSIKIATNTPMYERMTEDMDVNCGAIIDGTATIEEMGARIFEEVLAIASGTPSKSEALGFGDNEFAPWQLGAVM